MTPVIVIGTAIVSIVIAMLMTGPILNLIPFGFFHGRQIVRTIGGFIAIALFIILLMLLSRFGLLQL